VQKKVISQQQYDTQKALVAQLEATVRNDQAAVTSAQVQLDYARIISPINGRTGIRLVDAGNLVRATDQTGIVVITQLRPISLVFTLPEQSLVEIQQRSKSGEPLAVLALSRDNKSVLGEGKLTVIDNQIDTTTGTIRMKAEFPNDENTLWPGQFVNARLHLTTRKGGVVVPSSVIQRGPDGTYAYLIGDDMKVSMRPVRVAQTENGEALIDEGLKGGEKVVVDGQYKLQPGATVKVGDSAGHGGGAQPGGKVGPRPGGAKGGGPGGTRPAPAP
jgi:multidrug efflux system membrane fusion protein